MSIAELPKIENKVNEKSLTHWKDVKIHGDPKRNGKYVAYVDGEVCMLKLKSGKWYKYLDDVTYPVGSPRYYMVIPEGPWTMSYLHGRP